MPSVKTGEMKKIVERINKAQFEGMIPNYILITGRDKTQINKYRLGIIGMLLPFDRAEAKMSFIRYAAET